MGMDKNVLTKIYYHAVILLFYVQIVNNYSYSSFLVVSLGIEDK